MKVLIHTGLPEVETPYIRLWKKDGIIFGAFADQLDINLEIAKHAVKHRIELCKGQDCLCLIDMRGVRSANKEARDYFANEGARYIKAAAFLVNSVLTRALANFFLVIHKPNVPTRLFTMEEDAVEWLKKHA